MNPFRKAVVATFLAGTAITGGAIGASMVSGSASAQTPTTSSSTSSTASTATTPPAQRDPSKGGHQANGITEKLLTGDTATKVEAAAKAAVPGGTIQRVENDAEGATYEAHMTKADGTRVTAKVDANFKVTTTENCP